MSQAEGKRYVLPMRAEARYKRALHVGNGCAIAIFVAAALVPSDDPDKAIWNVVFIVLAALVAYFWFLLLFKRPFLTLTDSFIEYRWLYGHRVVTWADIERAEFHTRSNMIWLSIWASDNGFPRANPRRVERSFGKNYGFSINVSLFPHVDFEKLLHTIHANAEQLPSIETLYGTP